MNLDNMFYVFDKNHLPVESNIVSASKFIEDIDNRRTAYIEMMGHRVSTVFMVYSHSFSGGPPVLWETMIFKGDGWGEVCCDRYTSYEDALNGHGKAIRWLMEGGGGDA